MGTGFGQICSVALSAEPFGLLDIVGVITLMLTVFGLAYVTTRHVSGKVGTSSRGSQLQVIERLNLGKDRQIMLVKIGPDYFLAGITNQSIQFSPPVHPADFEAQLETAKQTGGLITQWLKLRKEEPRATNQPAD